MPAPSTTGSSLSDLTASTRRTSGQKPPPLVGASTTVVGSKLWLFGGRLVPTRTMVNTLYSLDLETLVWQQHWPPADGEERIVTDVASDVEELHDGAETSNGIVRGPQARYFHSCDAFGDSLFIFGGMGYSRPTSRSESPAGSTSSHGTGGSKKSAGESGSDPGLCVLNDLIVYDTVQGKWSFPSPPVITASSGSSGGSAGSSPHSQLTALAPSPRYAHLSCISNHCLVIVGGQDLGNRYLQEISCLDLERMVWAETRKYEGHCGTYRSIAVSRPMSVHYPELTARRRSRGEMNPLQPQTPISPELGSLGSPTMGSDSNLMQLPYSCLPSRDNPEPIFMYSNFNFSAVRRALDLIGAPKPPSYQCQVTPLSHLMSSGPSLPPGLRFPTGAIIGGHLVIAGTFLSHAQSAFAIWALDLANHARGGRLNWVRIDPGGVTAQGASWNRAVAWRNTFVLLGDRDRQIAEDYDHRQINFTHCAFVDLEAFGIYHPPLRLLPVIQQELALTMLGNAALADFDIVCSDGQRVSCSRAMLEQRWPWFASTLKEFRAKARASGVPGFDTASEVRITPRELELPESSELALAIVQYFYTLSLCTPLQHQLNILVGLLVFSKTYDVPNLRALATHALHGQLQASLTSSGGSTAVIYEAATLAGCLALQIRSLKTLMGASRSR